MASSIYIRALLRGTTLGPLMEADSADDNNIALKDEITGSNSRERDWYISLTILQHSSSMIMQHNTAYAATMLQNFPFINSYTRSMVAACFNYANYASTMQQHGCSMVFLLQVNP